MYSDSLMNICTFKTLWNKFPMHSYQICNSKDQKIQSVFKTNSEQNSGTCSTVCVCVFRMKGPSFSESCFNTVMTVIIAQSESINALHLRSEIIIKHQHV